MNIINGISSAVSRAADFVSFKQGEKVGPISDATAVAVTAVACTYFGPLLALQLAGTYLLGRAIHNQEPTPTIQFIDATGQDVRSLQHSLNGDRAAVRLIDDDFKGPTDLDMLNQIPGLTEHERMQIAQDYLFE